jgi:hypothetical protein
VRQEIGDVGTVEDTNDEIANLARLLEGSLKERDLAHLIAMPDVPNKLPIDQIEHRFSIEHDPQTWKTNVILLAGIAAQKCIYSMSHRNGPSPILGHVRYSP